MADRLRELIDTVLQSLDDPGADGRTLAGRVHFSRDHLDRLLSAATGESPVALRRRLLLERAAWQLRVEGAAPQAVAPAAGYGSAAAFSRAFSRAYGMPPSAFADGDAAVDLPAPNGIHFLAPAGLRLPAAGGRAAPGGGDLSARLLAHHLERTRELLAIAATLPPEALARPLRPGFVVLAFEGEEPSAARMVQRSVATVEIWVAAMSGEPQVTVPPDGDLLARFDVAAAAMARIVALIARRGAWDDAFVDALCEPPQSFTYGGVVAHVLTYGAVRREALAAVLTELGSPPPTGGDPIEWEAARRP